MHIIDKYTPGTEPEDVIATCKRLNGYGIRCSISFMPVEKHDLEKIHKDTQVYYRLLEIIECEKLDADITIKLNQFGVHGSRQLAKNTATEIVKCAHDLGNFVWIDMEIKNSVDNTIRVFEDIHVQYPNTGLCLQAYLKRTEADMHTVLVNKIPLRLVKGYYNDCEFDTWNEVTENYSHLMEYSLLHSDRPAIATHDFTLLEKAKNIIRMHDLKTAELQFFCGVRDEYAIQAVREGFNVRIYIPFGRVLPYLINVFSTLDVSRYIQRGILGRKVIT